MKLTIVGCGDAFGSGGRLQTCYLVDDGGERLLIDCGATAMIGLNRLGIDPNSIAAIHISHLHGDHFAGLVWWLLHAQHIARRKVPLTVTGPAGIEARFVTAAEALFPGCTTVKRRFELSFIEIAAGAPREVAGATVEAFQVSHPSGAPSHALRFAWHGRTFAFSGDTEWVEAVVEAGRGADLYLVECYAWDGAIPYHMSWQTIRSNLARIGARRIVLTHMSQPMLARRTEIAEPGVLLADDGLVIEI